MNPALLLLVKLALAPILLAQGERVRKAALRLPEAAGARSGIAAIHHTAPALRLLVVGDSSAAGVGVDTQSQALAQPLAEKLAARLQRSVHWHLLAQTGLNTSQVLQFVQQNDLPQTDVIVTALGVNDVTSGKSPAQFVRDYAALLRELRARTSARALLATAVPPMGQFAALPQPLRWYLGQCAVSLNMALAAWLASINSAEFSAQLLQLDADHAPDLLARDGYHPSGKMYALWAAAAADAAAGMVKPSDLAQAEMH